MAKRISSPHAAGDLLGGRLDLPLVPALAGEGADRARRSSAPRSRSRPARAGGGARRPGPRPPGPGRARRRSARRGGWPRSWPPGTALASLGQLGDLGVVDHRVVGVAAPAERAHARRGSRPRPGSRPGPRCCRSCAASHAVLWRTPRKRPRPASSCAASTSSTASPSVRSAWPTMPAISGPGVPGAGLGGTGHELDLADGPQLGRALACGTRRGTRRTRCGRCCGPSRCRPAGRRACRGTRCGPG